MPREKPSDEPSFGFLSTLASPEYGHFGGYLIVTPLGRPLEFHCTSPVQPSRAQEILYGPTLQPYLIGEQISGALLTAAKVCPCLVLVDSEVMLVARPLTRCPMAYVDASTTSVTRERHFDALMEAGGYDLLLPSGFERERQVVAEFATQLSQHVDLAEPFGRIHEAIREAQRIGGRAGDDHGQAA